ncbi:MBL fold metallo-hydrolase [Paenibacillus harenae]|uniref:Glyoxylase-like metal-dependent hydrolase (Beta-lactamase superfamily II) n=1 Tax=Paenibacillus harenae TaxID=306543 RepID=A0ABT9U727_PAEHA|nr:glyoxylase-like metal-dependent hydrolase (beta-lactamase superfamily II) [Paenibacillus harenae]
MNDFTNQQIQAYKPMTPAELASIIMNKQELYILDVRNEEDYSDWRIEGNGITSANLPYFDLLDGVEPALELLPEQGDVLVVCAKEGSSIFVAERLAESGRSSITYLQGGMKAWSEHLEPVHIGKLQDGGDLYQFVRLGKGCLSYMVLSGGEAAVIDSLRMTVVYKQFAFSRGARITHTIDTHLHADHISGGRALAEETGATYYLPSKDADEVVFAYSPLEHRSELRVGSTNLAIQPIYSPGHTIGSTSLIIDGQYLISGDILFVESIGRPDLAGKSGYWAGHLRTTLYDTYAALPKKLIVLPAHFSKYTELGEGGKVAAKLGDLFESNPGLHFTDEDTFRKAVTEQLPPQPNDYERIRQVNMGKETLTQDEQRDMEIGPNRCAIHDN